MNFVRARPCTYVYEFEYEHEYVYVYAFVATLKWIHFEKRAWTTFHWSMD